MEREIGSIYEKKGKKIKVIEGEKGTCEGCMYKTKLKYVSLCFCKGQDLLVDGECMGEFRRDKRDVSFAEVKE